MLPKIIPFSVDETFTLALMLQKSCGAKTTGCGRSTSFKSPTVASSSVQFCNVSPEINKQNSQIMIKRLKDNLTCLIDNQDIDQDIELIDSDVSFSVDGIRESSELCDLIQFTTGCCNV